MKAHSRGIQAGPKKTIQFWKDRRPTVAREDATVGSMEMICRENRKPLCKNRSKNNIESYLESDTKDDSGVAVRVSSLERLWTI